MTAGAAAAFLAGPASPAQAAISASIDGPVVEGAPGASLTVTLSRPGALLQGPASVRVTTTAAGTATPGEDVAAVDTVVALPGTLFGSTVRTVALPVLDDLLDEPDESVAVALTDITGDTLAGGSDSLSGTIVDDDEPPVASIADTTAVEGTGASGRLAFPVSLSAPSGRTVRLPYTVAAGTAGAADADLRPGTAVLPPGTVRTTITVPVVGDSLHEPDETLTVTLRTPTAARLGRATATGTIRDDDPSPVPAVPVAPSPALPVLPAGPAAPVPFVPSVVPAAPGASTPAADRRWPRVKVRRVTLKRPRTLRMTIACPADEVRCRVRTTVYTVPNRKAKRRALRREVRLARVTKTIAGGRTATVSARMTRRGLRLLRSAKKLRIRAYAVATDAADNIGTARRTVTIRR